ncbi:MAG: glycosyl transferase [Bacteroidetes bacterium]|nr:MAG: glycosyl transferase [Bacteroidota bacterium]
MLSILIPTYNYNALPLAEIIEQQALMAGIVFELICIDDGSFSEHNKENQNINSLTNSKFIENIKNIGSKANRQRLAEMAQYKWLLFIDADSKPKSSDYLINYLKETNQNFDAVFGGFAYENNLQDLNKTLRYTFGKHREEVNANIRNKNPYKVIISANFLIKKDVFFKISNQETKNIYGLDYLFSSQLKEHNIPIKHINNEVYHLGLDNNKKFLEKTRKAVEALNYVNKFQKIKTHNISLLRAYKTLKFMRLKKPCAWFYKKFKTKLEIQLTGANPNLFLFDLYRLGYLCSL